MILWIKENFNRFINQIQVKKKNNIKMNYKINNKFKKNQILLMIKKFIQ
jgi:hypothetical protein